MRKIPPFCPLHNDVNFDIEQCPRYKELQAKLGRPDEVMCRECIERYGVDMETK